MEEVVKKKTDTFFPSQNDMSCLEGNIKIKFVLFFAVPQTNRGSF